MDIDDIDEEGLLYDDAGLEKTIEQFQREKADGLFLPHANFGTEYECARLVKALNAPVLLQGPRLSPHRTTTSLSLAASFSASHITTRSYEQCKVDCAYSGNKVTEFTEDWMQEIFGGAFVLAPQAIPCGWMTAAAGTAIPANPSIPKRSNI